MIRTGWEGDERPMREDESHKRPKGDGTVREYGWMCKSYIR